MLTIRSEQAHGAAAMRAVSQGNASELQILVTRKQFMNAHSSTFNPVLTVRNNGNYDLMFSLDWYATDGGVDVQQGNCTGMSVRPGTTAEIDCGPMVIGHPDAKITLGQPSVTVR